MSERKYGYFGNYKSWQEAMKDSTGYDNPIILEKVKNAILKVKSGEAVYERDSVLFDKIEYSYPLLAYLLYIASANNNKLNVVDFGGSLGSTYFQCRKFMNHLKQLKWSIVEQKHFVACGQQLFEDDVLTFYDTFGECYRAENPNVVLLSGVLQCLENPYGVLSEIMSCGVEYLVFDRTPFIDQSDRITVQIVPPEIYESVYPIWFFNHELFHRFFDGKYELLDETDSFEEAQLEDGVHSKSKVMIFRKL